MSKPVIEAAKLSKQYRIGRLQEQQDTLGEAILSFGKNLIERFRQGGSKGLNRIWALKNVSFEVREGETLGIIGRNGSGKSTLLKILSRITRPTSGEARVRGRVGSLLEVGTGFHPDMTGRENIYLNGSILGMKKREIDRKFAEIVDFSECHAFLDTPVKRYSSGMLMRLAFSVAAHLEPEILIVDEVLAVGDALFQRKCMGKMGGVAKEGRTVLFVSHNMQAIRSLCSRTILVEQGQIVFNGATDQAIARYLATATESQPVLKEEHIKNCYEGLVRREQPTIRVTEVAILNREGRPQQEFFSDEEILFSVSYECYTRIGDLRILIIVNDQFNQPLLASQSVDTEETSLRQQVEPGSYAALCRLPPHFFGEGTFFVDLYVINFRIEHLKLHRILSYRVRFQPYNRILSGNTDTVPIRPKFSWEIQKTA